MRLKYKIVIARRNHYRQVAYLFLLVVFVWGFVVSGLSELLDSRSVTIINTGAAQAAEIEVGEVIEPVVVSETTEAKICRVWASECNIAVAVMKAESQGNPVVIGDKHLTFNYKGEENGYSVGLFQIRTGGNDRGGIWSRPEKLGMTVAQFTVKMQDSDENIKYAYEIYKKAGFSPWSTYLNGDYKKYL